MEEHPAVGGDTAWVNFSRFGTPERKINF